MICLSNSSRHVVPVSLAQAWLCCGCSDRQFMVLGRVERIEKGHNPRGRGQTRNRKVYPGRSIAIGYPSVSKKKRLVAEVAVKCAEGVMDSYPGKDFESPNFLR